MRKNDRITGAMYERGKSGVAARAGDVSGRRRRGGAGAADAGVDIVPRGTIEF